MKELGLIVVPLAGALVALVWPAERTRPWLLPVVGVVHAALALSGVFDLEPLRKAPFLKDDLGLTPAAVRKLSPAYLPQPMQKKSPTGHSTEGCGWPSQ